MANCTSDILESLTLFPLMQWTPWRFFTATTDGFLLEFVAVDDEIEAVAWTVGLLKLGVRKPRPELAEEVDADVIELLAEL